MIFPTKLFVSIFFIPAHGISILPVSQFKKSESYALCVYQFYFQHKSRIWLVSRPPTTATITVIFHEAYCRSPLTGFPLSARPHSVVSDSATPWAAAHPSQSLLKLMSIESVMPSNHLILCQRIQRYRQEQLLWLRKLSKRHLSRPLKGRILVCELSQFSSVQLLSHVRLFGPHELQHTRPLCLSPTPRVHPNPCPSNQWFTLN